MTQVVRQIAARPGRIGRNWAVSVVTVLLANSALACSLPDIHTAERPDPDGPPTAITMGFGIADVLGVDDVNQQLNLDFFVKMTWTDPRLADVSGCRFNVTEVWFPSVYILNSSNLTQKRRNARNEVIVKDGGQVVYVNRYIGNVSSYHNLARFPFDRQVFKIDISLPELSADQALLVRDADNVWLNDKLNIEGWSFDSVSMTSEVLYSEQAQRDLSVITVYLSAQRNSDYYIYRVLLLLAIVVAMSWVIFWVPPGRYEFQIGIGSTAMLTAIAFNFSIASSLPPVGYLTVMDRLVIWAVLLIFLATVQALATARLVVINREPLALSIDLHSRYVFPLAFFGGWALIIAKL